MQPSQKFSSGVLLVGLLVNGALYAWAEVNASRLSGLKSDTKDVSNVNEAADKKPIGSQIARYADTRPNFWNQVVVGAIGAPTALAIHPKAPMVGRGSAS